MYNEYLPGTQTGHKPLKPEVLPHPLSCHPYWLSETSGSPVLLLPPGALYLVNTHGLFTAGPCPCPYPPPHPCDSSSTPHTGTLNPEPFLWGVGRICWSEVDPTNAMGRGGDWGGWVGYQEVPTQWGEVGSGPLKCVLETQRKD